MTSYTENPKEYIQNLLELINEFSKVANKYKNHLYFYTLAMNPLKMVKLTNHSFYYSIKSIKSLETNVTKEVCKILQWNNITERIKDK